MILIANNDVSCNHIILQSFHHHEDASLALWALFILIIVFNTKFGMGNRLFSQENMNVMTLLGDLKYDKARKLRENRRKTTHDIYQKKANPL